MRLDRYLHDLGFGSRKDIDRLLKKQRVTVDGAVVKQGAQSVSTQSLVTVDGEVLDYAPTVWLMLNKPPGVITATKDARDETVMDLLPERFARMQVVPVGRLDKDTTGLLLLTNDGALAHRLMRPKSRIMKTYDIIYEETLAADAVARLAQGIDLGDFTTAPAVLEVLEEGLARLSISEGKFHQVKRMMHEVGGVVTALRRVAIASLTLDETLAPGEWRLLTQEELDGLREEAEGATTPHESL